MGGKGCTVPSCVVWFLLTWGGVRLVLRIVRCAMCAMSAFYASCTFGNHMYHIRRGYARKWPHCPLQPLPRDSHKQTAFPNKNYSPHLDVARPTLLLKTQAQVFPLRPLKQNLGTGVSRRSFRQMGRKGYPSSADAARTKRTVQFRPSSTETMIVSGLQLHVFICTDQIITESNPNWLGSGW